MLTHKIRDMPQHVFRNSTQSPSSDSNNSLSASVSSVAFQQQMQQQSQLSETHLHSAETVENLSDSDRRSHRQLNALTTAKKDNDFDKNVSNRTLTGVDQSNPTYLSSDDSSSMPSPIQSKNGANDFGSRSDGGANTTAINNNNNDNGVGDGEDDDNDDDHNEVQRSTRSSAAINIPPQHEIKTPTKLHESDAGDGSSKETEQKPEKQLTNPDYCQICSKRFDSFATLEAHMRSHKQFHCTICDKSFSTKGNLKVIVCLTKIVYFLFSLAKIIKNYCLGSYGSTYMAIE